MQLTETYSWDQKLYETFTDCVRKGSSIGMDQHIGSLINVEKKTEKNGIPYIEVIFQAYE